MPSAKPKKERNPKTRNTLRHLRSSVRGGVPGSPNNPSPVFDFAGPSVKAQQYPGLSSNDITVPVCMMVGVAKGRAFTDDDGPSSSRFVRREEKNRRRNKDSMFPQQNLCQPLYSPTPHVSTGPRLEAGPRPRLEAALALAWTNAWRRPSLGGGPRVPIERALAWRRPPHQRRVRWEEQHLLSGRPGERHPFPPTFYPLLPPLDRLHFPLSLAPAGSACPHHPSGPGPISIERALGLGGGPALGGPGPKFCNPKLFLGRFGLPHSERSSPSPQVCISILHPPGTDRFNEQGSTSADEFFSKMDARILEKRRLFRWQGFWEEEGGSGEWPVERSLCRTRRYAERAMFKASVYADELSGAVAMVITNIPIYQIFGVKFSPT